MPFITDPNQIRELTNMLNHDIKEIIGITEEDRQLADLEKQKYLNGEITNINSLNPYSFNYIVRDLPSDKQLEIIKDNLDFIFKHTGMIFGCGEFGDESLNKYLNPSTKLAMLNIINLELRKYIILTDWQNLIKNFTNYDYFILLTQYKEIFDDINPIKFISMVGNCYHEKINTFDELLKSDYKLYLKKINNEKLEFSLFLIDKYKEKILMFNNSQFIEFLKILDNEKVFNIILETFSDKIKDIFDTIDGEGIYSISSSDSLIQKRLYKFYMPLLKNGNIYGCLSYKVYSGNYAKPYYGYGDLKYNTFEPDIMIDLYYDRNELFDNFTLLDWLKIGISNGNAIDNEFDRRLIEILDKYNMNNIDFLNHPESLTTGWYYNDKKFSNIKFIKYIELKYRNGILLDGKFLEIEEDIDLFSFEYLKNLKELNELLKSRKISKDNDLYKKHLKIFIKKLIERKKITEDFDNDILREVQIVFDRIIDKEAMSIILNLSSIKEIVLFNRVREIYFNPESFTIEQLKKFNVKYHRGLTNKNHYFYNHLTLKLLLLVGYDNCKKILDFYENLEKEKSEYNLYTILEHLVGNVDVSNIEIDDNHNPILNTKIINLLFSNQNINIWDELKNQESDLYKYFPRIFNEWDIINLYRQDKSLPEILGFLKPAEICFTPNYYLLEPELKHIGISSRILNEAYKLHNKIIKRYQSTIPKVSGTYNEYTYRVLDLNDISSLSVGNKTSCCFTILGVAYSSLEHACTSLNGRILVVEKYNKLISHSWIFRNGNTIVIDDIEVDKSVSYIDFLPIYLEFADRIIEITNYYEENGVKNVTLGYPSFTKPILGIENFSYFRRIKTAQDILNEIPNQDKYNKLLGKKIEIDSLPTTIEEVKYFDSKDVQYLIKGNGDFLYYQSNYLYMDDRKEVFSYTEGDKLDKDSINTMNKVLNRLKYLEFIKENDSSNYFIDSILSYREVYGNIDWIITVDRDGNVSKYSDSLDFRSYEEMEKVNINQHVKKLKEF